MYFCDVIYIPLEKGKECTYMFHSSGYLRTFCYLTLALLPFTEHGSEGVD